MMSFQSVADQTLLRSKLLDRVQATEAGCWEWQGGRFPDGYGSMKWNGKARGTHRLSFEAFKGPIPDGMLVRHSCDNPPCINPDHLLVGTNKDNVADCISRGRRGDLSGENNGVSKLIDADILEIRASNEPTQILASKFGIDRTTIWGIRVGKTWKHVDLGVSSIRAPGRPAKLSVEDVTAIRASELSGRQLSEIFNVSQTTISMVRSGKHVLAKANGGA